MPPDAAVGGNGEAAGRCEEGVLGADHFGEGGFLLKAEETGLWRMSMERVMKPDKSR